MTRQPSLSFHGALAQAYRRACRAGIAEVGTDLVMCYAAARVRSVWERIPPPWAKAWQPVREGRPGIGDASPPARTTWEEAFDEEVTFEAEAVLRDAAYFGSERVRSRHRNIHSSNRRRRQPPSLPEFSPAVRHAVYEAIHEAARLGLTHAGPAHLLASLVAAPGNAAHRLLSRWRILGHPTLDQKLRYSPAYQDDGAPSTWAVQALRASRVLPSRGPWLLRWPWRATVRVLSAVKLRRPYRRHGARYGHPIPLLIEWDATAKAVHTGRPVVTAVDVLLSVIDFHEQLAADAVRLPAAVIRMNRAGDILAAHGVRGRMVTRTAARLASNPRDREYDLTGLPVKGWPRPRTYWATPPKGRTALAALREASLSARRHGHPFTGTTHLLGALVADPDGPVSRLLQRLGVDPGTVRADITSALEVVADHQRGGGALPGGGDKLFGGAGAGVAGGEHAGQAGLKRRRGLDEPVCGQTHDAVQEGGVGIEPDEDERGGRGDRPAVGEGHPGETAVTGESGDL